MKYDEIFMEGYYDAIELLSEDTFLGHIGSAYANAGGLVDKATDKAKKIFKVKDNSKNKKPSKLSKVTKNMLDTATEKISKRHTDVTLRDRGVDPNSERGKRETRYIKYRTKQAMKSVSGVTALGSATPGLPVGGMIHGAFITTGATNYAKEKIKNKMNKNKKSNKKVKAYAEGYYDALKEIGY